MSVSVSSSINRLRPGRDPGIDSIRGGSGSSRLISCRNAPVHANGSTDRPQAGAGPSNAVRNGAKHDDPVRAAQDEATRVWKADMRRLLDRAEERFADVCWTTASVDTQEQHDLNPGLGLQHSPQSSSTDRNSLHTQDHALIPASRRSEISSIPNASATSDTLIWAHKAILYARAPNSFHARFLNMRSPASQLQHIGSTASLVSLPLHQGESQLSLASEFSSSTNFGTSATASNANTLAARTGTMAKPRKSIRGAAPPSSFSMKKPSLRKPISRSSISRPLRKGSIDEANSIASGFATSDSEGEGGPAYSLRASRLINARSTPSRSPAAPFASPSKVSQDSSNIIPASHATRKPSFASVTSAADSQLTDAPTVVSDASTLRAPISLGSVSQAFFEATLQYLYTGEEPMVDAFEFLFEDRLASDSEVTPEQKLDKLRTDLTFMWRSKLYSDVKIALGDDDDGDDSDGMTKQGLNNRSKRRAMSTKMMDIPDANMSVLSLAQTVDTEQLDNSESEDDELTLFSAHRMILASRSQYFASMLLSPYADSRAPVLHLPSPPFTPASLHFTLGFLYTGTLFFSNRTFDLSTAFSLWRAGVYLQIKTLQALVEALIDREFCHGFVCSPPCRKCVKRVPRTLSFATSPDVSERSLQESALAAVSGVHFGMYWTKDIGNLDPALQDRIVESITERLQKDPTLVVTVLRQLSIVGQRIDIERSSRWVDALRLMAETVENRVMPLLHSHLEKIVQSSAFSDLLDGVGSLNDVLEKFLVMLVDGLTEGRAAQMYQILVGQVLLRDQGFEVAQSRQAVETARASLLQYLKKRWINVRALAGFNKLEKWCLKELADELDLTTTDLILTEGPSPAKLGLPPSRLMATRRTSSLAPGGIGANAATSATARSSVDQRPSLGSATTSASRVRTASAASLVRGAASPVRNLVRDDGEREAGPIHMRAAVLNRNAARASVGNGHRTLSTASSASNTSTAARAGTGSAVASSTTTATTTKGTTIPSPTARRATPTTATSAARTAAINGSGARSTTPNAAAASKEQRLRTTSSLSVSTTTSARAIKTNATNGAPTARKPISNASTASVTTTSSKAVNATPSTPSTARPTTDTDKTPTKPIRAVRSPTNLSPRTSTQPKPASTSLDTKPTKPASTSLDTKPTKPASTSLDTKPTKAPVLGHKSSFLRATPGPGGTFSLSTTDSGYELRARTISSTSKPGSTSGSVDRARSVTPTKSTVRRTPSLTTTSPRSGKVGSGREAMPSDAISNVHKAKQAPVQSMGKSESSQTIVIHPSPPREVVVGEGGLSLAVGIPCIVALSFKSSPSVGRKSLPTPPPQRKPNPSTRSASATTTATTIRKFRAVVRYLGPVHGAPGVWVGITLHLPPALVSSLQPPPMRLEGGRYRGVQYYFPDEEVVEEREARRKRRREVWKSVSPHAPFPIGGKGRGEEEREEEREEMFVRPGEVVWVVQ